MVNVGCTFCCVFDVLELETPYLACTCILHYHNNAMSNDTKVDDLFTYRTMTCILIKAYLNILSPRPETSVGGSSN